MTSRPELALDHLVVAAATLADGVAWCERTLGITPAAGGAHPLMGTHNRIIDIGTLRFPRAYLEIIAIDPGAPAPPHRRWFGLDEPALQEAIATQPRLVHWVARCRPIETAQAAWRAHGADPGDVLQAERPTPHALLHWRITVRADGRRLADGALPTLIEWGDVHPADTLPPCGVTLQRVTLAGIAAPLAGCFDAPIEVERPAAPHPLLRVGLDTPLGRVTLDSLRLEN